MTKIQRGTARSGCSPPTPRLYRETTATVVQFRELLTDIQRIPRSI